MNIGKKIKSLRLQRSITQEELAVHLSISAQAVSKWENDITTPDIQLLPELSAFFGVTIDELFDVAARTHLERIENMLQVKKTLSKKEYDYAQDFLKESLTDSECRGKCLNLLAELHNHEAAMHSDLAEYYAKEALKENPSLKDNHTALLWAQHGTIPDWNYSNHHKRIAFYQQFVKENPKYARGYMYLLDELIADGRLQEADEVLLEMKRVEDDCRVRMYEGQIAWARGRQEEAYSIWDSMVKQEPDNWLVYAYAADRYAADSRYQEAIEFNKQAYLLQPSPKYIDAYECNAHIYEIMGDYEKAVDALEEVIHILEQEWQVAEGEAIDRQHREIIRLKELEKSL